MTIYVVVDTLGYYHGVSGTKEGAKEIINDMKSMGYIQQFEISEEEIEAPAD